MSSRRRPSRSSAQKAKRVLKDIAGGKEVVIESLVSRRDTLFGPGGVLATAGRRRVQKRPRYDELLEGKDESEGEGATPAAARRQGPAKPEPEPQQHRIPPHLCKRPRSRTVPKLPALDSKAVRVWWPPTADPQRSDYSGCWWAARVVDQDEALGKLLVRYRGEDEEDDWVYPVRQHPQSPALPCAADG